MKCNQAPSPGSALRADCPGRGTGHDCGRYWSAGNRNSALAPQSDPRQGGPTIHPDRLAYPCAESAVIAAVSAPERPVRRRRPVNRWQRLTSSQVTDSMPGAMTGPARPAAGNDHKRAAATRLPTANTHDHDQHVTEPVPIALRRPIEPSVAITAVSDHDLPVRRVSRPACGPRRGGPGPGSQTAWGRSPWQITVMTGARAAASAASRARQAPSRAFTSRYPTSARTSPAC
jgi:hypothetical protein